MHRVNHRNLICSVQKFWQHIIARQTINTLIRHLEKTQPGFKPSTAKKVTFHVFLRLRKCVGNSTLQSKCQAISMKFGSVMYDFIHISDTGNSILF